MRCAFSPSLVAVGRASARGGAGVGPARRSPRRRRAAPARSRSRRRRRAPRCSIDGERVGTIPLAAPLTLADAGRAHHQGREARLRALHRRLQDRSQEADQRRGRAGRRSPACSRSRPTSRRRASTSTASSSARRRSPPRSSVGARAVQVSKGGYKDFFQNIAAVAGQEVNLDVLLEELPVGVNPYKPPPPPPPKWYEKWWVWTGGRRRRRRRGDGDRGAGLFRDARSDWQLLRQERLRGRGHRHHARAGPLIVPVITCCESQLVAGGDGAEASRGSLTTDVEPRPGCEPTKMVPPWRVTMALAMCRPSPRPERWCSLECAEREQGEKTWSTCSAGMPTLRSRTSMRTLAPGRKGAAPPASLFGRALQRRGQRRLRIKCTRARWRAPPSPTRRARRGSSRRSARPWSAPACSGSRSAARRRGLEQREAVVEDDVRNVAPGALA